MWNFNAVLQNSVPARLSLPAASRFSTGECHINVHVGHFNALITFWKLVDHCGLTRSISTNFPLQCDLNDFEVVDQFYVYFVRKMQRFLLYSAVFLLFVHFRLQTWTSELQTSAVSDFPEICCEDRNILKKNISKHERWKIQHDDITL